MTQHLKVAHGDVWCVNVAQHPTSFGTGTSKTWKTLGDVVFFNLQPWKWRGINSISIESLLFLSQLPKRRNTSSLQACNGTPENLIQLGHGGKPMTSIHLSTTKKGVASPLMHCNTSKTSFSNTCCMKTTSLSISLKLTGILPQDAYSQDSTMLSPPEQGLRKPAKANCRFLFSSSRTQEASFSHLNWTVLHNPPHTWFVEGLTW